MILVRIAIILIVWSLIKVVASKPPRRVVQPVQPVIPTHEAPNTVELIAPVKTDKEVKAEYTLEQANEEIAYENRQLDYFKSQLRRQENARSKAKNDLEFYELSRRMSGVQSASKQYDIDKAKVNIDRAEKEIIKIESKIRSAEKKLAKAEFDRNKAREVLGE